MTNVTHSFSDGDTIRPSEINTNFDDVVALVESIQNEQLAGGITADKISDRFCLDQSDLVIVPYAPNGTSHASITGMTLNASLTEIYRTVPVIKPNYQCYLCAFTVYVVDVDTTATETVSLDVRLNASTTLKTITLDTDGGVYLAGNTDPIANPMIPMDDGDFLQVRIGQGSGAATPAGIFMNLRYKHVLVG